MQMKEAIIRLKKTKQICPTHGRVAKSSIWFIFKNKECTGKLINNKRPRRPQQKTKVDQRRIISLVKKNLCVSIKVKKTPKKEALVQFKNRKARLYFARKHLKKSLLSLEQDSLDP